MPALSACTLIDALRRRKRQNLESLGKALGRSTATVQRYCVGPNETGHVHPPSGVGAALKAWSGGFVHLGNCTDPWTPEIDAQWLAAGLYTPAPADRVPEDVQ